MPGGYASFKQSDGFAESQNEIEPQPHPDSQL